jgi:hypothetical protein
MNTPPEKYEAQFKTFDKVDLEPYLKTTDDAVKTLASMSGIDRTEIDPENVTISIDIQRYIDDTVTSMYKQFSSQVESNLNAILERAFRAVTADQYDADSQEQDDAWREFLRHLAEEAGVAVSIIEERNDG